MKKLVMREITTQSIAKTEKHSQTVHCADWQVLFQEDSCRQQPIGVQ
jgi:hypothetical protein